MNDKFILLVDDDTHHAILARRAFDRNGLANRYKIMTDGTDALKFLLSDESKPAVVLLDLNMPRVDGLEILRRLRADSRTKSLPVLMLTSLGETESRLNVHEPGVDGYIRKPIGFSEFVEIIRKVGLYWLGMDDVESSTKDQPT